MVQGLTQFLNVLLFYKYYYHILHCLYYKIILGTFHTPIQLSAHVVGLVSRRDKCSGTRRECSQSAAPRAAIQPLQQGAGLAPPAWQERLVLNEFITFQNYPTSDVTTVDVKISILMYGSVTSDRDKTEHRE